jgi:hypothetical protein
MDGDVLEDDMAGFYWQSRVRALVTTAAGLVVFIYVNLRRIHVRQAAEINSRSRSAPTAAGFLKCSGSCGDRNRSPFSRNREAHHVGSGAEEKRRG